MKKLFSYLYLVLVCLFSSCSGQLPGEETEFTRIGATEIVAKNLNVGAFRNGDPIPEAKTSDEWVAAGDQGQPAWCYYNNDAEYGARFGRLYNWFAVSDPRGLVPEGWHLPSDQEWDQIGDALGGSDFAGQKMKSSSGWEDQGNGNDESGFAGLPGGYRNHKGAFGSIGPNGSWWSSTEANENDAWSRDLYFYDDKLSRNNYPKAYGFSVRYIRD